MAKQRLILGILVGAALTVLYAPAFLRWAELKSREDYLKAEMALLRRENFRLAEEARRLREDPAYAEAVARKELGLVRPGETVVKFRQAQKLE